MITLAAASWDRLAAEPPENLYRLRVPGHWRGWDNPPHWIYFGQAIRQIGEHKIGALIGPRKSRRLFLDVGCGHSRDAGLAVRVLGFKAAIKVDLWPLYSDCEYFANRLKRFDGKRVRFIQGDICTMQEIIEDDSVDFINCNAMIDLLTEAERDLFYSEAFCVLRPGGILAIAFVPLKQGYGWNGWREIQSMRRLGLHRINNGVWNHIIVQKGDIP